MAKLLDGRETSKKIKSELLDRVNKIKDENIIPHMTIIRVGNDPASIIYLKYKRKACESIGIKYSEIILEENTSEEKLISEIKKINNNKNIHGLIVQFPLPNHISKNKVINSIDPKKDIDGLHPENTMKMYYELEGLRPCTPMGIITLLEKNNITIEGKDVVVIGRSKIVGEPLSKMLLSKNATVTTCFSKTKDLAKHTKQADIVISAVGIPHLVKADMVKKGVIAIDVGVSRENGKIVGDIAFEEVSKKAK